MGTLITRCQQRCDLENSSLISTAEWRSLISEQFGDLYSVVAESGLRYFEYETSLTTTGAAYISEPADHLGTVGLDYVYDTTNDLRRELTEIMAQEQARWSGQTGSEPVAYAFVDDRIYLFPTPATGLTLKLRYIPQPPDLTTFASDTCVDVVTPDGEAFLTWGVMVKALAKSEADVSLALSEREAARVRLAEWATLREFNKPRRRQIGGGPFDSYGDEPYDSADWRWRR